MSERLDRTALEQHRLGAPARPYLEYRAIKRHETRHALGREIAGEGIARFEGIVPQVTRRRMQVRLHYRRGSIAAVFDSQAHGEPFGHAEGTRPGGIVRGDITPGKVAGIARHLAQYGVGKPRGSRRHRAYELDSLIHDNVIGLVQEQHLVSRYAQGVAHLGPDVARRGECAINSLVERTAAHRHAEGQHLGEIEFLGGKLRCGSLGAHKLAQVGIALANLPGEPEGEQAGRCRLRRTWLSHRRAACGSTRARRSRSNHRSHADQQSMPGQT